MPKYRVLEKSFINNAIAAEGDIVDFDGKPGPNLEPVDKPAQAAAAEAAAGLVKGIDAGDVTRQKVAALGGTPDAVDASAVATAAANAAATALQAGTLPPAVTAESGAAGLV